jgi:hypothetical protein
LRVPYFSDEGRGVTNMKPAIGRFWFGVVTIDWATANWLVRFRKIGCDQKPISGDKLNILLLGGSLYRPRDPTWLTIW